MTIDFDWDAARRRRFDGGMPVHDDVDAIIVTRRRWVANCENPDEFCPRCTGHKARFAATCHPCTIETRDTDTDQGDT